MTKIASKSFWHKYQERWQQTGSVLCVGLDPEFSKLPDCVKKAENPIWEFNKAIIDSTAEFACAFKPNLAFYLADGLRGLEALYRTVETIPEEIPVILDCKVGDIGSTMSAYVSAFFNSMQIDAITLNPLMGTDVVKPVLDNGGFAFALCLTSNPSAADFLKQSLAPQIADWILQFPTENLGAVIGATQSSELKTMRSLLPGRIFLIPGIGAQGGDLEAVLRDATDSAEQPNILVNSSRGIIFASNGTDFATAAAREAKLIGNYK